MTNIYLNDKITLKLLKLAEEENKVLIAAGKNPSISKSTIASRIIYAYFEEGKK